MAKPQLSRYENQVVDEQTKNNSYNPQPNLYNSLSAEVHKNITYLLKMGIA